MLGRQAEIYAGRAGSGTVLLTVYDAEDRTNNDTIMWSFTVTAKQQATPPVLELSRGSVDLGSSPDMYLEISNPGTASAPRPASGPAGRRSAPGVRC